MIALPPWNNIICNPVLQEKPSFSCLDTICTYIPYTLTVVDKSLPIVPLLDALMN
jgi:hypothetical protein